MKMGGFWGNYLDEPLDGSGDVPSEFRPGNRAGGIPEVFRSDLGRTFCQSSAGGVPEIVPVETSFHIPATSIRRGQPPVSSSK